MPAIPYAGPASCWLRWEIRSASRRRLITRKVRMHPPSSEVFRLSPVQQRLWSLRHESADSAALFVFRLNGSLDRSRLRHALGQIVQAHEILRTRFYLPPGMNAPCRRSSPPEKSSFMKRTCAAIASPSEGYGWLSSAERCETGRLRSMRLRPYGLSSCCLMIGRSCCCWRCPSVRGFGDRRRLAARPRLRLRWQQEK